MRSYKLFLVTLAGLVAAACAYLGTGLHPIWWMLWLAPIPVLAIAPRFRGGIFCPRFGGVANRRNESMELRDACHRTASASRGALLRSSRHRFRLRRAIHTRFSPARIAFPGRACFPQLLGGIRISHRYCVASQHVGESRLQPNQLPPRNPDRFDHRHLGNQLHRVSVCWRHGGTAQRCGKTHGNVAH